jgi:hypothetical protein
LIVAVIAVQNSSASAQAPAQLYNKTIQAGWTASAVRTGPDGQKSNSTTAVYHTVYVSSAGRLFERASRAGTGKKGGRKQTDNAPGATSNRGGEATGLRFQGRTLVGSTAFAQGARRWVVSFDPSFSSCTVTVTFGREGGGLKRRGIDGVMYTIESMTASGESCSIREGNPFG